ncbi:MAG: phosphoribosylformylglycinamidine cyclo-ligase [Bdellovibrionales bacterium]|nr:phosphoribosylformylglycinamidine cyclo-ligase [Bdellovibrionales bacterium]
MAIDYKKAGVDVEKGDKLVDWIKSQSETTSPFKNNLISGVGGFASIFKANFQDMKSPCLVSCTDGVGTKVLLANEFHRFFEVGIDLVAMSINDMICSGAKPLFFLDYYACGKLELNHAQKFISGVKHACDETQCLLIGGETAEMPGVYKDQDFDCAGFAVGVVDEEKIIGKHKVEEGNVLIGLSSSGFHSNGYSLVRKLFDKDMDQWIDDIIKPTHLYADIILNLYNKNLLNAVAHITGGGMDNLLRVMPEGFEVSLSPWKLPKIFQEAQTRSELSDIELLKTFNCGVGMILVVPSSRHLEVINELKASPFEVYNLGVLKTGSSKQPKWTLDGELQK